MQRIQHADQNAKYLADDQGAGSRFNNRKALKIKRRRTGKIVLGETG